MRGNPIKEYRLTLTLECDGRSKTATNAGVELRHDLYGTDDHMFALKDLQDTLISLIFALNGDEAAA